MSQYSGATIQISDDFANYARRISSRMSTSQVRKKGLVNILAIKCAAQYFTDCGLKVNISRGLHNIAEIFEEFQISDIYINNYRVDVLCRFRDGQIKIPIAHKECSCPPDYYVVVDLSDRLKDAGVAGYFKVSDINFLKSRGDYIPVNESHLKSTLSLVQELRRPSVPKAISGKHLDCAALFLRFIDGELGQSDKKFLIQHLLTCPACTKRLLDVLEFNRAIRGINNISSIMKNYSISSVKYQDEDFIEEEEQKKSIELPVDDDYPLEKYTYSDEKYRNIIDGIFDKNPKIETSGFKSIIGSRKRKIILTLACIFLFLGAAVFIAFKNSDSDISSISDVDSYSQDSGYDLQSQADFASDHNLPQEVYGVTSGSDYSIASQTTGEPLVATINKVSWEVPENIANRANYTRFLQLVGKNIKLNLQNDLLLSSDFAKNNVIKLSIRIASNGDVIGMKILQGSGSEPIDNIIKKSVSETLMYMKPPSHGLIARPVDVTLIISL